MELLIVLILCGVAGYFIGDAKGKAGVGVLCGGLLGFIGLIIIAVLPPTPEVAARQAAQRNQGLASAIKQATSAAPQVVTVTDQLTEIEHLFDTGKLSLQEYAALRRRITGG